MKRGEKVRVNEQGHLLCPSCGRTNVHPESVKLYVQSGVARQGVSAASPHGIVSRSDLKQLPMRPGSVVIKFVCEACGIYLRMLLHRRGEEHMGDGCTKVEWDVF